METASSEGASLYKECVDAHSSQTATRPSYNRKEKDTSLVLIRSRDAASSRHPRSLLWSARPWTNVWRRVMETVVAAAIGIRIAGFYNEENT